MSKVRPEKVSVVDEVKAKVDSTSTAVVTEYRGMTVAEISTLRRQLRSLDADYKVFKNTLVRRAIQGTSVEPMGEFLEGPTAIAFVQGDVSAVAKALRDYAKATPTLKVKGGVVDGRALSLKDLNALADLPSRDVLLAMFAGLLASPMRTMAGLLKAVPQNFAYGLSALIDSKGGPQAAPKEDKAEAAAETPAGVEEAAPAASDDAAADVAEVAVEAEAPVADAEAETTEAPVAEAPAEEVAEAPADEAASEPAE
jgi:large subunit ribosomal protein L10